MIFFVIYVAPVVLIALWLMRKKPQPVVYSNVVVKDVSGLLQNKIFGETKSEDPAQKAHDNADGGPPSWGEKIVSGVASKTSGIIAPKISVAMPKEMKSKFEKKGIFIDAQPIFVEGNYFVLEITFQKITCITFGAIIFGDVGTSKAIFNTILPYVPSSFQDWFESQVIPYIIAPKMVHKMGPNTESDAASQGIAVEAKVVEAKDQAAYFYAKYAALFPKGMSFSDVHGSAAGVHEDVDKKGRMHLRKHLHLPGSPH
jgi:hypothetical protein|uniref:SMP-LTD domain-containing protein n=1 Tax=Eutreptiella gymnastica TaxID=73025 RepID=A0A7S4FNR7_9EUGL